jgi:hypothetical protein
MTEDDLAGENEQRLSLIGFCSLVNFAERGGAERSPSQ